MATQKQLEEWANKAPSSRTAAEEAAVAKAISLGNTSISNIDHDSRESARINGR